MRYKKKGWGLRNNTYLCGLKGWPSVVTGQTPGFEWLVQSQGQAMSKRWSGRWSRGWHMPRRTSQRKTERELLPLAIKGNICFCFIFCLDNFSSGNSRIFSYFTPVVQVEWLPSMVPWMGTELRLDKWGFQCPLPWLFQGWARYPAGTWKVSLGNFSGTNKHEEFFRWSYTAGGVAAWSCRGSFLQSLLEAQPKTKASGWNERGGILFVPPWSRRGLDHTAAAPLALLCPSRTGY